MMKKFKWRNLYIGEIKISNPEEEIIYNVPKNDKIIEALVEIYKKKNQKHLMILMKMKVIVLSKCE